MRLFLNIKINQVIVGRKEGWKEGRSEKEPGLCHGKEGKRRKEGREKRDRRKQGSKEGGGRKGDSDRRTDARKECKEGM